MVNSGNPCHESLKLVSFLAKTINLVSVHRTDLVLTSVRQHGIAHGQMKVCTYRKFRGESHLSSICRHRCLHWLHIQSWLLQLNLLEQFDPMVQWENLRCKQKNTQLGGSFKAMRQVLILKHGLCWRSNVIFNCFLYQADLQHENIFVAQRYEL